MPTFLFDKIIFGPVISRRLGISLGINLLPVNSKICSFDCIYCECGRNPGIRIPDSHLPEREEVKVKLREKLMEMMQEERLPDVITFAGNGEPTLHPGFAGIIEDTLALRDQYATGARIAVLSNATMLHRPDVFNALLRVDDNIQKLDSALEATIKIMDCPRGSFNLNRVVDQLSSFKGKVIIQTMFIRGEYKGIHIDNSTEQEVINWIRLLKIIGPSQVMIYTIARDTPVDTLEKINYRQLEKIARRVEQEGFNVQIAG